MECNCNRNSNTDQLMRLPVHVCQICYLLQKHAQNCVRLSVIRMGSRISLSKIKDSQYAKEITSACFDDLISSCAFAHIGSYVYIHFLMADIIQLGQVCSLASFGERE